MSMPPLPRPHRPRLRPRPSVIRTPGTMVELPGSGVRCQTAPCLSSGRRGPRGDPAMGDDGGSVIGAVMVSAWGSSDMHR
jgi:hypothetical protein